MSYLLTMFKYLCSHYQAHGEFSVSTFFVNFINVNKILNQCPSKISSFSVLTGTKSHRWSPFFALPKQGCLRKQFFIDPCEMWLFLCQFLDFLIDHTDICLCCVPLNWLCVKSASWQLFERGFPRKLICNSMFLVYAFTLWGSFLNPLSKQFVNGIIVCVAIVVAALTNYESAIATSQENTCVMLMCTNTRVTRVIKRSK